VKKKPKVLALFDSVAPTTLDQDLSKELKTEDWETEKHVLEALKQLGCPSDQVAIYDDMDLIRQKIEAFQPDIIFNLADRFKRNSAFDQNIVSFLELQDLPFTGCGSTALTLCKHKGISKKILSYHRIRVPQFAILPRGKRIKPPKNIPYPIFVKPLKEEASYGISKASFVESDEQFRQRVLFIHETWGQDVIAEEYIHGRELYVGVLGLQRLQVLPVREMAFHEVPTDEPNIATFKAKWDADYRERWGIENDFPKDIDAALTARIQKFCRKIYHLLAIDGYARLDLRLTPQNEVVFLEANPNPILARHEDFAQAARRAGLSYANLIEKIMQLGFRAERY
jgi:D-alanine-D-alanine ligase